MSKTITKSAVLILGVIMLLALLPSSFSIAAKTQEGFEYIIEDDKAVIIGYTDAATQVVIPSQIDGYPVVAVGNSDYAPFTGSGIVSVVIPDSVEVVGIAAFMNCKKLQSVSVGLNVKTVERNAFRSCSSIAVVYYKGSSEQWNAIEWGSNNNALQYAENITYNYIPEDVSENHKPVKVDAKDATCDEDGNTEYWLCEICQKVFSDENAINEITKESTVISSSGHYYPDEWTVDKNATCKTDGTKYRVCTRANCGNIESDLIPAKNHKGSDVYTDDENIVAGTCKTVKRWERVTYCSDCNAEIARETVTGDKDPTNHTDGSYIAEENIVFGTCKTAKTWNEVTYCKDCDTELSRVSNTGDKNPTNHTGGSYIAEENIVFGTCKTAKTWNEVTYCKGCDTELGRVSNTGEKNPTNHTGGSYIAEENIVFGTCKTAKTWNEVTYCKGCDTELGRVSNTGEKNPTNHIGGSYIAEENIVFGTCKTAKTWNEVTYCKGCDTELGRVSKTGDKNPTNHTGGSYIAEENIVFGTCKTAKTWNEVTYCKGCDTELGRTPKTGEKNPTNHTGGSYIAEENIVFGTCKTAKTCNEVTYCKGCDAELGRTPKIGEKNPANHTGPTFTQKENETEGTCIAKATWQEVTYCSDCRKAVKSVTVTGENNKDKHSFGSYVREKNPACTVKGSEYATCSYCKTKLYRDISATGHKDSGGDGICDICFTVLENSSGNNNSVINCSCNCHASGFGNLIFRIILFFQKIFGLNRVCAGCGQLHY